MHEEKIMLKEIEQYLEKYPKEIVLLFLFLPYHTMDSAQAIERILEAKEMLVDEDAELKRQYEIFKRIRKEHCIKRTIAKSKYRYN